MLLAIALTVAVAFAWGYDVEQAEAGGSLPPAEVELNVDLNGDGQVALRDLLMVAKCIGKATSDTGCESSDVNGDGGIAIGDLLLVLKYFGQKV